MGHAGSDAPREQLPQPRFPDVALRTVGRLSQGVAEANQFGVGTTLDIREGAVVLVGSTSLAGAFNPINEATILMNGGDLILDSKGATLSGLGPQFDNAITVQMSHTDGPIYGYLHLPCRVEVNSALRAGPNEVLNRKGPAEGSDSAGKERVAAH